MPVKHASGEELAFRARVGRAIRRAREEAGYTRDRVEKELGLTRQTMIHIEEGAVCPLFTLYRLAHVFDVTIDELVPDEVSA